MKRIYPFEWVMVAIYFLLILLYSFYRQVLNIKKFPEYRYYTRAVVVKIFSSVIFCCIYIYYYHGGDTVSYFETARSMVNLGMTNPGNLFHVVTHAPSPESYSLFSGATGYPWPYMYYDTQTFFVTKLLIPILYISFRSYLLSSVVLSWFSFFGAWKLFRLLITIYPGMEKRIAFSMLFVPSVLFWGSGILKDTITLSAVCWFIYSFYRSAIGKKKRIANTIIFILSAYVLLSVKPYVLIALLPGTFVWFFHARIINFRSKIFRYASIPMIYVISFLIGYIVLTILGSSLGKFSVEKMLKTASITQHDLKQDYYQGSSFDIGDFDPTISGVMSKVPAAMNVGLFRPFLWEARNVVMIISGLENFVYLLFGLVLGWRMLTRTRKFFGTIFNQPLLLFLLSYSLIFSSLVGLSTSNFGALVRFKIPFLSFFVLLLLILDKLMKERSTQLSSLPGIKALDRITGSGVV
ncbi:MAG: hypothetical protein HY064_11490 [Bacteroidetes bacterium]|nr:hypothetical protein [Bacteroidota bacterium]